jgi:hypothetical protein
MLEDMVKNTAGVDHAARIVELEEAVHLSSKRWNSDKKRIVELEAEVKVLKYDLREAIYIGISGNKLTDATFEKWKRFLKSEPPESEE